METVTADSSQRLISLDVFRGMTIAGMVLVNNPGTWTAIYGPLKHAEWHGITPTDYIFPFFLFIVGVAIPIALRPRMKNGVSLDLYQKIIFRSLKIFAIGLLISIIPFFIFRETLLPQPVKLAFMLSFSAALFLYLADKKKISLVVLLITIFAILTLWLFGTQFVWYNFSTMRIPGVLQRIAVCYFVGSLIFLHTNWKQQTAIAIALLLLYWIVMTVVPLPGCDVATIDDKACNAAAWLDRIVLTEDHIWKAGKVFDPEGILSTIPAIVTTLTGVLAGTWLKRDVSGSDDGADQKEALQMRNVAGLFFAGTILLAAGWSWSLIFPLNKSLWTGSYVLYTSGLALLALSVCYYVIDINGYRRWAKPFVIFGVNALALFVFSGLMARMLSAVTIDVGDGKTMSFQQWIFSNVFLSLASPINASLLYAICFIVFWLFLMWLLYRRRLLIKL